MFWICRPPRPQEEESSPPCFWQPVWCCCPRQARRRISISAGVEVGAAVMVRQEANMRAAVVAALAVVVAAMWVQV